MIYGTEDADSIDKAVRLVIMLIMIVFDPLAVLLLIAANMTMQQKREGTPIVKNGEIVGLKASDIPVFVPEKPKEEPKVEEIKQDKVEVEKENIVKMEEPQPIVLDDATGETIPPLTEHKQEHVAPGVFHEWHEEVQEPSKKLEPKYDYNAEFAFKEKKELDGGKF